MIVDLDVGPTRILMRLSKSLARVSSLGLQLESSLTPMTTMMVMMMAMMISNRTFKIGLR